MTDTNEQTLSTEAEDALLSEEHDPKKKTLTTVCQDPMFSMIQNVNKTLGAMADSIHNMNQSLKRLHPSNTDDQLDPKRRKYSSRDKMIVSDGSDEDGDDSGAELQTLGGAEADKTSKDNPRARLEQSDGGNDPLLSEIAEDLLNADIRALDGAKAEYEMENGKLATITPDRYDEACDKITLFARHSETRGMRTYTK